jgi:uncharacterized protein YjiS (DUF1127 family)
MSCGSTACTSTTHIETASPWFSDVRWLWRISIAWLTIIAQFCEQRSRCRELLELDDHLLADIGLSRHQIADDALKNSRALLTIWHAYR